MDMLTLKAYAKINLALDVVRRREDGYHDVKMIMQTVGICDELTFQKIQVPKIEIRTDAGDIPTDENNLIYKAAKMLLEDANIEGGVSIYLKKVIPVAAGMAGGSTDAAATFRGINKLFELNKTQQELMEMGVKIGADIPYCIMGGTALSEGIGEILTPLISPPACYLLIAKPDIYVSTKYVYENLRANELKRHPDVDAVITEINTGNLQAMCEKMENVLEYVTVMEYPIIEDIKNSMKEHGAQAALMSGSGPTVFGIFEEKEALCKAYEILKDKMSIKQIFITEFVDGR